MIGMILISFLGWTGGTFLGAVAGTLLPAILTGALGIMLYAMFIAIVVPAVKENKQIALLVLITAVLNVILGQVLGNWSLIVSTLIGAGIGMYLVDDEYVLAGDA